MPANVIAFTVSGHRQKYLRQSLGSWAQVRGIGDWHLLFSLEPCRQYFPIPDFTQWLHRVFGPAVSVHVHDERQGCLKNTRAAMSAAFGMGAEFAVLAEEDVRVSLDTLEYLTWARDTYRDQAQVQTVCCHVKESDSADQAAVVRVPWFAPLIWGTWKDRWQDFILPTWGCAQGNLEGWDNNLREHINKKELHSIFPVRSRALHIGQFSSLTPGVLAEVFYEQSLSHCFSPGYEKQEYREVPFNSVPGLSV